MLGEKFQMTGFEVGEGDLKDWQCVLKDTVNSMWYIYKKSIDPWMLG